MSHTELRKMQAVLRRNEFTKTVLPSLLSGRVLSIPYLRPVTQPQEMGSGETGQGSYLIYLRDPALPRPHSSECRPESLPPLLSRERCGHTKIGGST